jgi:hypothetical protein
MDIRDQCEDPVTLPPWEEIIAEVGNESSRAYMMAEREINP